MFKCFIYQAVCYGGADWGNPDAETGDRAARWKRVYCQFISAGKKGRCEASDCSDQQTDSSGFSWSGRRVDRSEELAGQLGGQTTGRRGAGILVGYGIIWHRVVGRLGDVDCRWWDDGGALLRCCLHTLDHTHEERAGEEEEEDEKKKKQNTAKHNGLEETGFSTETWNEGCTLRDAGSLRRATAGLIILTISKGPIYLGASFLESRGRSLDESHTFWPGA